MGCVVKEDVSFVLNGRQTTLTADPEMPLLWALRDLVGLTGTKFGCGAGLCGACTVLLDGAAARACLTRVGDVSGTEITTIEGFDGPVAEALRQAWLEQDVVQCGYCQSGQLLAASVLLRDTPMPATAEIDSAMSGNICRCGSYQRLRAAITQAAVTLQSEG